MFYISLLGQNHFIFEVYLQNKQVSNRILSVLHLVLFFCNLFCEKFLLVVWSTKIQKLSRKAHWPFYLGRVKLPKRTDCPRYSRSELMLWSAAFPQELWARWEFIKFVTITIHFQKIQVKGQLLALLFKGQRCSPLTPSENTHKGNSSYLP